MDLFDLLNSYATSLLIFLPLAISAVIVILPNTTTAKWTALLGSILPLLLSFHVWFYFKGDSAALQFVERYEWLPDFGITYFVGIDGLSLLLVLLTTFLTPLVLISQWHVDNDRQKYFLALIMALESTMIGALTAIDLVFFYVFWEAMLLPMYFIIGIWGGANRIYATTKFFIYTVVGSLLMLAAALVLYHMHYQQFGFYTTSLLTLFRVEIPAAVQAWMFAAFGLAFAIKVPMWPFHTWLPDAHVQAPTAGSVILAGILLKMGTYGFLRFAIPLFPLAAVQFGPLLVGLGLVGIIYGALVAWMQADAKKLVAYSSVSHLGFVVIGSLAIIDGTHMSEAALMGAVYQMINHGISTGALFFLVGIIYERRHTRMLSDFGGLASSMPWFAVILVIVTLSSIGLPGTGGFIGEFLILFGTFESSPIACILAATGVLLGAIYMLTLVKAIIFGPLENEENKNLKDINLQEASYLVPLVILAVVMGIFPNTFLNKVKPSVEHLAKNFLDYSLEADESNEKTGVGH